MKIEELEKLVKKGILIKLHTSYRRGYVSRKSKGIISPYKGRFGKGFVLDTPCYHSTSYHFRTYFVYTKGDKKWKNLLCMIC